MGARRRRSNRRGDRTTYFFIFGIVAIVVMGALVFKGNTSIVGAPVFEIQEEFQKTCTDDDPQNDFYEAGTVKFGHKVYDDYCSGEFVIQHHCKTGANVRPLRPYECPNGCLNGACLAG